MGHQQAINKAHAEYDKYRALIADEPSLVEKHFNEALKMVGGLKDRSLDKKEKN